MPAGQRAKHQAGNVKEEHDAKMYCVRVPGQPCSGVLRMLARAASLSASVICMYEITPALPTLQQGWWKEQMRTSDGQTLLGGRASAVTPYPFHAQRSQSQDTPLEDPSHVLPSQPPLPALHPSPPPLPPPRALSHTHLLSPPQ